MAPLRLLGRSSGTQLEISRVKDCLIDGKEETLRRTKDMASRQ
jgi:hypothetical protein